jgi:predicted nucleic acid-binding protein
MLKKVVVDASVAAKWVVEEDHSAGAALLLECEEIHAPEHWLAEAVNVLWSKVLKGDLERNDAEERMTALMRAPVIATPIAGLMSRAFAISVEHAVTIYDSLYVALALERGVAMVTADERLVRRFRDTPLADRVVWIGGLE